MAKLKRITLEMSIKPFKQLDDEYVRHVCRELFNQWHTLIEQSDELAVMLWTSDGSEILDYKGNSDDTFEWANLIGGANVKMRWNRQLDPDGLGLHTRSYPYTENAPVITYGDYRRIIQTIKKIGHQMTGKKVLIGATFDPGPEFAVSTFKYKRHPEILVGESMGEKSMVCCYATLNEDHECYATYPKGIPDGTTFGKFFGKQAQRFFADMKMDFLWLSNGFGFGTEAWGVNGALFDGKRFYPEKLAETRSNIQKFWDEFGAQFHYPVQVRGTNLTVGIDFASDGVDHHMIYGGNRIQLPPPNSPWAALDGNFGLELVGFLSHIAELPLSSDILFRFYVHDPWWHNSPWIDRYEGQPHDIYMPMSLSRLDGDGCVHTPNFLHFLTVDNSYGEMPDSCPAEITPFVMKGLSISPDQVAPFVLVYPFEEYSTGTELEKPFFEDWFLISLFNHGLPVSSVVSTKNFVALSQAHKTADWGSVLVSPVPLADSDTEKSLIQYVKDGGYVLLYGSLEKAGEALLKALGLARDNSLSGTFVLSCDLFPNMDEKILSMGDLSDGGLCEIQDTSNLSNLQWSVQAKQDENLRVVGCVSGSKGKMLWCRGNDCSRKKGNADDANKVELVSRQPCDMAMLAIQLLSFASFKIQFRKPCKGARYPIMTWHRHEHSLWLNGFCPDTRVSVGISTPLGAPILCGHEPILENGVAWYTFPRAWQKECRVFVQQDDSASLFCHEAIPARIDAKRRLEIGGLQKATVRILCKSCDNTFFLLNSQYPMYITQEIHPVKEDSLFGKVWRLDNVTGTLMVLDR